MDFISMCLRHPVLLTAFMFYGFQWYSGVAPRWREMPIYFKVPTLLGGAVFYAADVLWNVQVGSLMYWEWPFVHGITFSQRTEHWINADAGWRTTKMAAFWTALLNWWSPGHIKVKKG
jgi:hypothetical protein